MVGIGFIGLGNMGMYQVAAFVEAGGCNIVAGSDPSPIGRQNFAARHPDAKVYETHQELLANPAVEAVVIVTPTSLHKDIAIDALRAGKAVLCEKPLGRTVADCRAMIDVASETGKLLMAAHCRRYDTDWGTIRSAILDGRIGRPVIWRDVAATKGPGSWFMDDKMGGGPLIDGAVHNYDFANWLFGTPRTVYASTVKLTTTSAVDTGSVIVTYESGDQLTMSWSWGVAPGARAFDQLGPKGSLTQGTGKLTAPEEGAVKRGHYCVTDQEGNQSLLSFDRVNMYATQAKHFMDCIAGKAECRSPGSEAIKAVAVAEALFRSAASGRIEHVTW